MGVLGDLVAWGVKGDAFEPVEKGRMLENIVVGLGYEPPIDELGDVSVQGLGSRPCKQTIGISSFSNCDITGF
jgi:hypothetical protein